MPLPPLLHIPPTPSDDPWPMLHKLYLLQQRIEFLRRNELLHRQGMADRQKMLRRWRLAVVTWAACAFVALMLAYHMDVVLSPLYNDLLMALSVVNFFYIIALLRSWWRDRKQQRLLIQEFRRAGFDVDE